MHPSTPLWSLWAACSSAVVHVLAYASLGVDPKPAPNKPANLMHMEFTSTPTPPIPPDPPPREPVKPEAPVPLQRTRTVHVPAPAPEAPASEAPAPQSLGVPLTSDAAGAAFSVPKLQDAAAFGLGRSATQPSEKATPPRAVHIEQKVVPVSDLSSRPTAPRLDTALRNNYPSEARRRGIAGSASVRARIDPDGMVREVTPLNESFAGFAEACRRTVRGSSWSSPRDRSGRRVATQIRYTCRFLVTP